MAQPANRRLITEDRHTWDLLAQKPTSYPPAQHTHDLGDVTGLAAALSAKVGTTDPRLPRIDTTVGTRVFIGDTMLYGETGKRDITELLASGLSPDNTGRVLIFRRGSRVVIEFADATLLPGAGALTWAGVLGAGWRPHQGLNSLSVTRWNDVTRLQSFTVLRANLFWGSEVSLGTTISSTNTRPPDGLRGQIEYDAEGWPTALPGTPA